MSQPAQSFPDYPADGYVVKYESRGNAKWVNHVGGYKAIATEIATSHNGQVTITGFVGNIADSPEQASTIVTSQPGGKNINPGGGVFTVPFNDDAFIATFNRAGVLLDARAVSTSATGRTAASCIGSFGPSRPRVPVPEAWRMMSGSR